MLNYYLTYFHISFGILSYNFPVINSANRWSAAELNDSRSLFNKLSLFLWIIFSSVLTDEHRRNWYSHSCFVFAIFIPAENRWMIRLPSLYLRCLHIQGGTGSASDQSPRFCCLASFWKTGSTGSVLYCSYTQAAPARTITWLTLIPSGA